MAAEGELTRAEDGGPEPRGLTTAQRRGLIGHALLFAAMGAVTSLLSQPADWEPIGLVLVLGVFAVASEAFPVRLWGHMLMSGEALALVLVMALLGPAPAVAIAIVSALVNGAIARIRPLFIVRNLNAGVAFCLAGGAFADGARQATGVRPDQAEFALLVVATYAVVVAVNLLAIAAFERVEGGERMTRLFRVFAFALPAQVPGALLAAGIAVLYAHTGLGTVGLLAIVLFAFQVLLRELRRSQDRATELGRQADELAELHAARGRLVAQALDAEDRERRRLAEALHDEAIQNLLAALQDLREAEGEGSGAAGHARTAVETTVGQLRDAVFELHPAVLRHAGLGPAIEAVATQQGRRGGFEAKVEVDPAAAGVNDMLVYSLAREQLVNAAKHAAAKRVQVRLAWRDGNIELEVADDGRGMDLARRAEAARSGHIGLASSAERVEAIGGSLQVESAPGEGTRVRTRLPVETPAASGNGARPEAGAP